MPLHQNTAEGSGPIAAGVDASSQIGTLSAVATFRPAPALGPPTLLDSRHVRERVVGDDTQSDAFQRYVVPEIDVLYRVARSITRNPTDAEDLVQDTMLRAYRAIDRFDGRYPRAWLLTIMRNAQINRVRRKRPELLHDPDAAMERLADEADNVDPETLVVESQYDAVVERAFSGLSEKFRTVVELVDIQGLSYQEASEVLGVPVGTVMSRLHRARTRIRNHLEASADFEGGRRR